MEKEFFCPICQSNIENPSDPIVYNPICSKCGNRTLLVDDLSSYVAVENGKGGYEIFTINLEPNANPSAWVEIWTNEDGYKRLVSKLTRDKAVTVTKNDSQLSLEYSRNGCEFSISYVPCVDYLMNSYSDGDPFVEFSFVQKDDPDFKLYKDELARLCFILRK